MESAARRSGGVWERLYRVVMRRTPVYVTFVVVGAFLGCGSWGSCSLGSRQCWEKYEDISVLGQRQSEE